MCLKFKRYSFKVSKCPKYTLKFSTLFCIVCSIPELLTAIAAKTIKYGKSTLPTKNGVSSCNRNFL